MANVRNPVKITPWVSYLVIATLLFGSLGALRWLYGMMDADRQALAVLEAWKSFSALALVGIGGGLVSFLFKRLDHRRAGEQAVNNFRTSFLERFQGAYRDAKTVRRTLRAAGVGAEVDVAPGLADEQVRVYKTQMKQLNRTQLDFEDLVLELESFPDAFSSGEAMTGEISGIEHYFREILMEYEEHGRALQKDQEEGPTLDSFQRLSDLVGPLGGSRYRENVVRPRRRIVRMIRSDLLPLRLAAEPASDE